MKNLNERNQSMKTTFISNYGTREDIIKSNLIKEISQANAAYASGLPFITDAEYDILWQQLYSIDPTNPLLYHTAQNRSNLTGKSWHKQPIFGTNKAFNMEDLKIYLMRFGSKPLRIEPKYDGCAAVITRTNTDLGMTITLEGDGQCGSDITQLYPFIKLPSTLRHFQAVELLIPLSEWNPSYGANPRNVVAGWLARKYDKPSAMITAISHNDGPLFYEYNYSGDLESFGELLLGLYNDWSKIYPMDGLMIKVADEKARLIAGNNGQTNNWSIAWKPPIQIKETVVTKIEWNVSRLGRIIPTIIYFPVELCGTINTRVTGNNAQWVKDRKIKIGSIIIIGKAGEIIPKILGVNND
jgi:NAD-dependent DNA ligase